MTLSICAGVKSLSRIILISMRKISGLSVFNFFLFIFRQKRLNGCCLVWPQALSSRKTTATRQNFLCLAQTQIADSPIREVDTFRIKNVISFFVT